MDYVGHHTCSDANGLDYIEKNAPFPSNYIQNSNKKPFLGTGYYFWDFDLHQAHHWGKVHYNGQYRIVQGLIRASDDNFIDLVGSRKHMHYFRELIEKFAYKKRINGEFRLGAFIELLKTLNKTDSSIFPFEIIRAQDHSVKLDKKYNYYFRDDEHYINLNPRHIFCLLISNNVVLPERKVIF